MHPLGIADQVLDYQRRLTQRLVSTITYKGVEGSLDERDRLLIIDCFVMRYCLLHDLFGRPTSINLGEEYPSRMIDNWRRTTLGLSSLDVEPYSSDWKVAREILTSPTIRTFFGSIKGSAERTACREAFKRLATDRFHYKWILNSILDIIEFGGLNWFELANQWIVFDSRVNLRSLDLTSDCCTDYLSFEESLPSDDDWEELALFGTCEDDYTAELICQGRLAARRLFGDFNITDYPFRPSHGNGATAEVHGADLDWWHKNRQFAVDEELITYLKHRLNSEDWRNAFFIPYRGVPRTSELRCVPKSMTSNRTISMEPTTLQFLQQDVFLALDEYFSSRPDIPIDLHDQEASRRLCEFGSSDGSYATIDLSSASDSVTTGLIHQLFDGLPIVYPLFALRSTRTHVCNKNGDIDTIIPLKKYAPMGSSLCFPVECMVFTIACTVAVLRCTGRMPKKYDFMVYGDDIVIRTRFVNELLLILDRFGFIVNKSKSFYDIPAKDTLEHYGIFREACGIEAINGIEITPLRLSRRLVSPTDNDSDHQAGLGVGLVDLVNRAFLYRFWTLRRWVNDVLNKHRWYRTCLRVEEDDYTSFCLSIRHGTQPWVPLAIPYVITPNCSATQWRAWDAKNSVLEVPTHAMMVKVTVATAGSSTELNRRGATSRMEKWLAGRVLPHLRRTHLIYFNSHEDFMTKTKMLKQRDTCLHDENDYFSWWCKVGRQSSKDPLLEIDATGLVTIRSRDLKWSQQWVGILHPAHPSFSPCPGDRKGRSL